MCELREMFFFPEWNSLPRIDSQDLFSNAQSTFRHLADLKPQGIQFQAKTPQKTNETDPQKEKRMKKGRSLVRISSKTYKRSLPSQMGLIPSLNRK
jgi:hypothetical protein